MNFLSASCILVKNSSMASKTASMEFSGSGSRGKPIEAQKMKGKSGVHMSSAVNVQWADVGLRIILPDLFLQCLWFIYDCFQVFSKFLGFVSVHRLIGWWGFLDRVPSSSSLPWCSGGGCLGALATSWYFRGYIRSISQILFGDYSPDARDPLDVLGEYGRVLILKNFANGDAPLLFGSSVSGK